MQNIKNKITASILITLAILILFSMLLRSFNLFIIAISLILSYKLFNPIISKKIFDSKFFASTLVFFSYIILLQCTILISWLLNHNFSLVGTPTLLLAILFIIYGYNYFLHRKENKAIQPKSKIRFLNFRDILSMITAIIIVGVIVLPPIALKPEFTKSTSVMSLITGNVDDSSHLSLVNDNLQFDRGVIFKSDAEGKTRNGGFYPAGWHSVSAILIKMICPSIKTGSASLLAYGIQKLFWFFVLLYLLSRVSISVFGFLSNKKLKASSYIWAMASLTLISYVLLLPIYKEGFYSFLPQLIAALLAVPVIMQICLEKDTNESYRSLPLLFIVCIGGCLSWLLPLPAFMLAVVIILLSLVIRKNVKVSLKNIYNVIKENAVILLLLSTSFITQIYTMTNNHNASSISLFEGIMLGGGITIYDKFFYIFIFIGLLASLILASKKVKKNVQLILVLLMSLALFCTYIFFLQINYMGKNEYYYYKILDILTLITVPFFIAGFGLFIHKIIDDRKGIIYSTTITLIILATFIQLIGLDSSTLSFARGYRAFSSQIDNSMLKELSGHISQKYYFDKHYSFYYVPDSKFYFQNEVAAMMAKSNAPDSECFISIRHAIWKSPQINQLLDTVDKECQGYRIDIITNSANRNEFKEAVITSDTKNIVTIKTY